MTKTYTVAVRDDANGGRILYALQEGVGCWHDLRGVTGRIDATRRDSAVAEALESGYAYDVIEHDGQVRGGTHIGGTSVLIAA